MEKHDWVYSRNEQDNYYIILVVCKRCNCRLNMRLKVENWKGRPVLDFFRVIERKASSAGILSCNLEIIQKVIEE